jgi:hypothetical protein
MTSESDEAELQSQPAAASASTRPAAKFSGWGGLNVAVWKQKSDSGPDFYSVRIDRTYKNDAGGFETTPYLRASDLLRAQKLLGKADDWIEQDRAKHRTPGGQDQGVER